MFEWVLFAALMLAAIGWAVRYRRAAMAWRKVAIEAINLNNKAIATSEALLLECMRRESVILGTEGHDSSSQAPLH